MRLHFDSKHVLQLLEHSQNAPDHWPSDKRGPGLCLVGDNGVYLMSSGEPRLKIKKDHSHVCYAYEVNPHTMPATEVWAAQRASWGCDDGLIFIPVEDMQRALKQASHGWLAIYVTPEECSMQVE